MGWADAKVQLGLLSPGNCAFPGFGDDSRFGGKALAIEGLAGESLAAGFFLFCLDYGCCQNCAKSEC